MADGCHVFFPNGLGQRLFKLAHGRRLCAFAKVLNIAALVWPNLAEIYFRRGILSHRLSSGMAILRLLGTLSLEVYLIHLAVFEAAEHLSRDNHPANFFRIPEYALSTLLTVLLAFSLNKLLYKVDWSQAPNKLRESFSAKNPQ